MGSITKAEKKETKDGLTATNSVVRLCHLRGRLRGFSKTSLEERACRIQTFPVISETST